MSYEDRTLEEFLSGIASERVAPAGGTAAAVVGAVGAALCEMVCIHTLEKGEHAAPSTDLADARDALREQRDHLLQLASADARVIDELFPTSGDDLDQSDIKRSIGVPLAIADGCLTVLDLATVVTENGTRTAVTDAGTGVFLVHSALQAALFTVRSNVGRLSDPSFIAEIEGDLTEIETDGDRAYRRALDNVEART